MADTCADEDNRTSNQLKEEKPKLSQTEKEDGSDDLDFEDARDEFNVDDKEKNKSDDGDRGDDDDDDENDENDDDDDDDDDDEQLMVIETPEGLTLVEPTENSSFYIVQENEGQKTPPVLNNSEPRIPPDVSISDELLMNIQHFRRSSSPELPDTVTKLETVDGCKVYLVGTAHFSKESQDDVEKTIQAVQPDVVLVELCKSRVDILKYDEDFLLREAKNIDLQKLKLAIKQSGVVGGVMQVLLLSVSAHITKQLGMAPGGEFRAAYREAKKTPGCQIHLGDRPIQVTLSRAMGALSIWQKVKLGWHLLTTKDPISREDVERCKQKDLLAEMLAEMTGDFPTLYKVFVSERDQYLARSLRLSAAPIEIHSPEGEPQGVIPSVVVGVVGIGHVEGITQNWDKQIDVKELLRIPETSRASRLIRFSLKAFVGVFLAWGCYRIGKYTRIASYIPYLH
ncbi:traB domain-containing protein-like isoform X2 [Montipora capricornis]|uniref:traB domain-containing protein-like isoform X2 n=1 Tax=Montipora capricornis TaxID=246305 RepID=UPI0035F1A2B2